MKCRPDPNINLLVMQATVYVYELVDDDVKVDKVEYCKPQ
jgi:hypothetical protein